MSKWCPPWNSDCLNVITFLAMSQDGKKLKRLARRFGLFEQGQDQDIAEVFHRCHEAAHRDTDFAKALGKDLDSRFSSTVARIRSLELEEVKKSEMNWPMPLLWATLTDDREEVRLHGRYLLHGMLWSVLHGTSSAERDQADLKEEVASLKERIRIQSAEIAALKVETRGKEAEADSLRILLEEMKNRTRVNEPIATGNGRLTREIRKLEHELMKERQRTAALTKIDGPCHSIDCSEAQPSGLHCENASGTLEGCPCETEDEDAACGKRCEREGEFCEKCPLEGLRVAVIGGIERLLPAYRKVVQQLGAEFLFHDGGVKSGGYRLKGVVCGADIVVFITTVNSHGALDVVKAVCKKNGKRFIALRETGAESLGRTLKVSAA